MNSLTRILPALLVSVSVAAVALPGEAQAAPCGSSAATIAADTWQEFHNEAIAFGCAVGVALGTTSYTTCYDNLTYFAELGESLVAWWNDMANNSWATIGPRQLQWSGIMNGTLQSGAASRLFCSATPSNKETVDITIEKLDGKAQTEVEICKMHKNGTATVTHTFTFANGDANIGTVKTRTVTGAKDDIICVHLNNQSVGYSFQYSLDADKF
ncbi:MAG TPA: hypothetical protein VGB85_02905 [Nannocystis sp.]|jgi:hypothetical protein